MKRCLVVCSLLLILTSPAAAENWPQWRGPHNDGISTETNLPTEWSATKNVLWKLKMPGMGGSTPAIWGDRMFLTSAEGNDIVLLCVSTDGKELWKRKLGGGGTRLYMRGEGNCASASPSTDGKHVWVFTGNGDLDCFDFDGKEVWAFNAQERYGAFKIMHGMHSTPLLDGDRLYVQLLHAGGFHVMALDKMTGKEIWKIERKSDGRGEGQHSYASPVLWRKGKDAYLIIHGCDYATAHRLDDGAEIWRVGGLNPKDRYRPDLRFVASPLATPDLIVIPSAKNHGVVGLKPDAEGSVMPGSKHEQWRMPNGTPDVPSPLIYDGLVYLCGEWGQLTCLEAKTGKELYSQKLHRDRYRASPVYAGGNLYLTSRDGTITVVKVGPKFEQVAVNKLPDEITASPVVSGGRIYLRGFDTLYAIGPEGK
jgi:outer membrane protein assembly factor BamB